MQVAKTTAVERSVDMENTRQKRSTHFHVKTKIAKKILMLQLAESQESSALFDKHNQTKGGSSAIRLANLIVSYLYESRSAA